MNIFVTGGAGFIGSHLVDSLIERGNSVTVYDNLSTGRKEFIRQHIGNKAFRFIEADILDRKTLEKSLKGHDMVFHLAAHPDVRFDIREIDVDLKQNTLATHNLLEAMRLCGTKKIAFTSSNVVYGDAKKMPTPEDYGPLIPISLYAASKLACEGFVTAYCHTFGFQSWIFRFANIVGERSTHGVTYDFVQKLRKNPRELEVLGDGNQKKSYLLVEECVDGILTAVEKAKEEVNIFNIGSGSQISAMEIARIVIDEMGYKNVRIHTTGGKRGWVGDVPIMLLDTTKLRKLGWKPKHTSEEAIRVTARYIIENL